MLTSIIVAIVVVACTALLVSQMRGLAGERDSFSHTALPPVAPAPHDYAPELKAIREDLDVLRLAVGEGIQHVERVEKRISATVRRARTQLAESGLEHDGLEAEYSDLHFLDGGGGEAEAVPAMPESVEGDESSIPGVSAAQLRRAHGG